MDASNESDAGKIKAYAKELNNAYKFPMADECKWGGLCFCDLGVNYGTTRPDNADDFDQLVACAMPLLSIQGIEAEVNDDTQEITWGYSEENEAQVCDEIVAKVGELMPEVKVVCMKHDEDNPEFGGLQYCILGEGDGEWREFQGVVHEIAYAIWYVSPAPELGLTVYDAVTDPVRCAKVMLDEIRKGTPHYDEVEDYVMSALPK